MFSSSYKSSVTLCSLWTISEDVTNHWSLVKEKHWRLQIQLHENLNVDPWQGKIVRWWDVQFGFWRPIQINNTYAIPFAAEQVSSCFLSQNSRRNGEWSWFILFDVFFPCSKLPPGPTGESSKFWPGYWHQFSPEIRVLCRYLQGNHGTSFYVDGGQDQHQRRSLRQLMGCLGYATLYQLGGVAGTQTSDKLWTGNNVFIYFISLYIYIYVCIYIYPYYNIFIYIYIYIAHIRCTRLYQETGIPLPLIR